MGRYCSWTRLIGALLKVDRFTKTVVLLNCLVPVTLLAWDAWGGRLGADPVNFAIHTTGILALIFLIMSLAVTPASRLTGWGWLVQFRRMLGLCASFMRYCTSCSITTSTARAVSKTRYRRS